MNKKIIWAIIFVALLAGVGIYFTLNQQKSLSSQTITNFEECVSAGYRMGESYPAQCWTPDGKHFVEDISKGTYYPLPKEGKVNISGEITCLPSIGSGSGPQSMECAIGLKGTDGRYYALKNLFESDPEYKFSAGGMQVEVSGIFSREETKSTDSKRYNVIGAIEVTSIKEITASTTSPISKSCFQTGCSGQICADEDVITTCEYRPEYGCYNTARCERQASGKCGFTQTPELISCLAKPNRNQAL